jgi:hypothetical protein
MNKEEVDCIHTKECDDYLDICFMCKFNKKMPMRHSFFEVADEWVSKNE